MQVHEITTYQFEELNSDGQEKAIEKYRDINTELEWWDCSFEDFQTIGALMGIEIENIYFSGFYSQGDGAQFEGYYSYNKGSFKEIKSYAPQDSELQRIAKRLQELQKNHFYQISAIVKHSGHYYHPYCTDIAVYKNDEWVSEEIYIEIAGLLRDFMIWIYRQLEKEHEYLTSDEAIKETLTANEYEFTEEGEIY